MSVDVCTRCHIAAAADVFGHCRHCAFNGSDDFEDPMPAGFTDGDVMGSAAAGVEGARSPGSAPARPLHFSEEG